VTELEDIAIKPTGPQISTMPRAKSKKEEPAEAESDIIMEEAPTSHQPEDDMSVDEDENDDVGDVEEDEIEEEEEEEVQRVRLVRQICIPVDVFL
jgi:hypothetical protein